MNRTMIVQPTSRVLGGSVAVRSAARELVEELARNFGLNGPALPVEQRGRMPEFSDKPNQERAPAELKLPGVVSVRCNYRTGKKTIEYRDGRVETRAFGAAPDPVRLSQPQRESPRIIVAALMAKQENDQRTLQARYISPETPGQIVEDLERRFGLQPATARALTDQEYQRFQDPAIGRPDDYDDRLGARNKKQLREVLEKRAAIKQRQARAEQEAANRGMVALICG